MRNVLLAVLGFLLLSACNSPIHKKMDTSGFRLDNLKTVTEAEAKAYVLEQWSQFNIKRIYAELPEAVQKELNKEGSGPDWGRVTLGEPLLVSSIVEPDQESLSQLSDALKPLAQSIAREHARAIKKLYSDEIEKRIREKLVLQTLIGARDYFIVPIYLNGNRYIGRLNVPAIDIRLYGGGSFLFDLDTVHSDNPLEESRKLAANLAHVSPRLVSLDGLGYERVEGPFWLAGDKLVGALNKKLYQIVNDSGGSLNLSVSSLGLSAKVTTQSTSGQVALLVPVELQEVER